MHRPARLHANKITRKLFGRYNQTKPPSLAPRTPLAQGVAWQSLAIEADDRPPNPFAALRFARPTAKFPRDTLFVFYPPKTRKRTAPPTPTRSTIVDTTRSAMTSHIDIITSPTADTPGACLYVHFDKRRYLFGHLSEGVQRAVNQRKLASISIEQMFVSGEVSWRTVGGMMGLLITLSDVINGAKAARAENNADRKAKGRAAQPTNLVERLDIHGAENLTYSLATARNFIFRTGMPFRTHEYAVDRRLNDPANADPDWQDDCINVWKVPLRKNTAKSALSKKRKRESDPSAASGPRSVAPTLPSTAADSDLSQAGPEEASEPESKRQKSADREALSAVVESMFNSGWRMDALVPTKLYKVELPATVFVRGEDGTVRKYAGPLPGTAPNVPDIDVLVREPWPAATVTSIPATTYSSESMCYIVKNHERRGKFKASVAKELGVKPPDFRLLTMGESVPGKDGTTVTPDMVLEPPLKGKGFALIDVPDESYIESLLARPEWSNSAIMEGIEVFYWVLSRGLAAHPAILKFMRERPTLRHIVLAPDVCPNMISFESIACMNARLQRIDNKRFPTLQFDNRSEDLGLAEPPFQIGRVGKRIQTMPHLEAKDDGIVPFCNLTEAIEGLDPKVLELADKAAAHVADPEFRARVEELDSDLPGRDVEVIPLGTGSAMPSRYRNVSSTLIRVPGVGSYLFDCGENTLGQLRRALGNEEAERALAELRCLFISHMHADHHLGTVSVLSAWQRATASKSTSSASEPQLVVSCTHFMKKFLEEISQVEPLALHRIRFSGWEQSDKDSHIDFPTHDESGLSSITRVRVEHCRAAHAGILRWPSGLSIAYSGDCRPSQIFAERARGATLLIHECTFEDDKRGDALAKKHSTVSEALGVAEKMRARRVLLTHFSQRYAKVPVSEDKDDDKLRNGAKSANRVVLMAFDQMRVKLGDFREAAAFLPAIRRYLESEK